VPASQGIVPTAPSTSAQIARNHFFIKDRNNMHKNKLLSTLLLSATLGATAFGASAEEHGFYMGAGVGQSRVNDGSYDDRDTAFSMFGGFDVNQYFAVEGGYADLGKLESDTGGTAFEATAPYVAAVGKYPINEKVSVYAKAGFNRWSLDNAIPSVTGDTDDSGTDPLYGLGVQYRLNDKIGMRGDYSRFKIGDADVNLAQVQVTYHF